MNATAHRLALALGVLALTASCTASNSSIQAQQSQQVIKVDGSSTVFPITQAIAKEYQKLDADKVQVSVGISGTTGGFKKFCSGETDITNASRPILTEEMEACNSSGVRYIELPIAFELSISPFLGLCLSMSMLGLPKPNRQSKTS